MKLLVMKNLYCFYKMDTEVTYHTTQVIYCLPNTILHVLQMLDVGIFKPMKNEWKMIINE